MSQLVPAPHGGRVRDCPDRGRAARVATSGRGRCARVCRRPSEHGGNVGNGHGSGPAGGKRTLRLRGGRRKRGREGARHRGMRCRRYVRQFALHRRKGTLGEEGRRVAAAGMAARKMTDSGTDTGDGIHGILSRRRGHRLRAGFAAERLTGRWPSGFRSEASPHGGVAAPCMRAADTGGTEATVRARIATARPTPGDRPGSCRGGRRLPWTGACGNPPQVGATEGTASAPRSAAGQSVGTGPSGRRTEGFSPSGGRSPGTGSPRG